MMTVVVVFEEDVLGLICGYAPQSGRKTVFYDEQNGDWDIHSASDLVMYLGEVFFNLTIL